MKKLISWIRDNIYILQNATPVFLLVSGIGLIIASMILREWVLLVAGGICWGIVVRRSLRSRSEPR